MGSEERRVIYSIPTVEDSRGNLSYVQKGIIPFEPTGVSICPDFVISGVVIPLQGEIYVGSSLFGSSRIGVGLNAMDSLRYASKSKTVILHLFEDTKREFDPLSSLEEVDIDLKNINPPFETKRVFYITDIPAMTYRGGHSHFRQQTLIMAVRGAFRLVCDDGFQRKEFFLDHPSKALYLVPEIWREMDSFQDNTIVLVLASTTYDPSDYIYDYDLFIRLKLRKRK